MYVAISGSSATVADAPGVAALAITSSSSSGKLAKMYSCGAESSGGTTNGAISVGAPGEVADVVPFDSWTDASRP